MEKTLSHLAKFKGLPTYQFERRIDAFLLPYLETFFSEKFPEDGPFTFLYPEFPLRRYLLESIDEKANKLADAADYLLFSKEKGVIYFVELKTDIKSITEKQFTSYYQNCEAGWQSLIENYIFKSSGASWRKFAQGLKYLETSDGLLQLKSKLDLDQYIDSDKGRGVTKYLKSLLPESNKVNHIYFVYLAPQGAQEKLETFVTNNPQSKPYYKRLISLSEFAENTNEHLKNLLIQVENESKK